MSALIFYQWKELVAEKTLPLGSPTIAAHKHSPKIEQSAKGSQWLASFPSPTALERTCSHLHFGSLALWLVCIDHTNNHL